MYLRLFNDIRFSSPCGGLMLWRSPDGRAVRASRTLRSRSVCRHSVSLCLVSKGPQFRAKTPKPVFKVKAVVSRENAWCACFVLCRGDNALWRSNTIQLPPLHGHTLPLLLLCLLSFLSSARCVYASPYFKNIGAAGFAVYSGPGFKGTSGMFYWTLQRFTGRVGTGRGRVRCPDALRAESAETPKQIVGLGVLVVDSSAQLWPCLGDVVIWRGRESLFRKWIGRLNRGCGRTPFPFVSSRFGSVVSVERKQSSVSSLYQRAQVFFRSRTLSYTHRCWHSGVCQIHPHAPQLKLLFIIFAYMFVVVGS